MMNILLAILLFFFFLLLLLIIPPETRFGIFFSTASTPKHSQPCSHLFGKSTTVIMKKATRKDNGPLKAPPPAPEQKKTKVSKALKAKLLTILCRELNEELSTIKQTKAAQIKNQKAVRVQSIKNKRKDTAGILPSKRFKMLQTEDKSNSSVESRRIDPFARRKVRANPANIFK